MNIKIAGKLVHPVKLIDKNIDVIILGERKLVPIVQEPEKYHQFDPSSVATLTISGNQGELLGSVPFDVVGSIGSLLQAEKSNFLCYLARNSIAEKPKSGQSVFKENSV